MVACGIMLFGTSREPGHGRVQYDRGLGTRTRCPDQRIWQRSVRVTLSDSRDTGTGGHRTRPGPAPGQRRGRRDLGMARRPQGVREHVARVRVPAPRRPPPPHCARGGGWVRLRLTDRSHGSRELACCAGASLHQRSGGTRHPSGIAGRLEPRWADQWSSPVCGECTGQVQQRGGHRLGNVADQPSSVRPRERRGKWREYGAQGRSSLSCLAPSALRLPKGPCP